MIQKVQEIVNNGSILYLGFLSNSESEDGTTNSIYVSFSYTYHYPSYNYTVKNSFEGGTIKVDNVTANSGTTFSWTANTNHTLLAINQPYGGYDRVWNTTGVSTSISNWQKRLPGQQTPSDINNPPNATYVYTTTAADAGASIIAKMFIQYNVTRNDLLTETNQSYNSSTLQVVENNTLSVSAQRTKTINGSLAYFKNWSATNATVTEINNPNSTTADANVVATGTATVTAVYTYQPTLLTAGTYNVTSSLSIPTNSTLTLAEGVTMNFSSSVALNVNGNLVIAGTAASPVSLISTSGNWAGITMNSWSQNSTINNCIISNATYPVSTYNAQLTMTNTVVNGTDFGYDAALRFYDYSGVYLTNVTINGVSNSSNGIRYSGSFGAVDNCLIQNCGVGNGIVVEGFVNLWINNSTIKNNRYHGVVVLNSIPNGGGVSLNGNTIENNGLVSGNKYFYGVTSYNSSVSLSNNIIHGSNVGICSENYSSFWNSWNGVSSNKVYNNNQGLNAGYYSSLFLGYFYYPYPDDDAQAFTGGYDEIYNNSNFNALAHTSSTISALNSYWGQPIPDAAKIYVVDAASAISYVPYLSSSPGGSSSSTAIADNIPPTDHSASRLQKSAAASNLNSKFVKGMGLLRTEQYDAATKIFNELLNSSNEESEKFGLVGLYNIMRESKNKKNMIPVFEEWEKKKTDAGRIAAELLTGAYMAEGRNNDAKLKALSLRSKHPKSDAVALLYLASLNNGKDENAKTEKNNYLHEIKQKYSSKIDDGILAAFGYQPDKQTQTNNANAGNELIVSNYPNPFNPTTTINYALPKSGNVVLKVYDVLRKEVATLVNDYKEIGRYSVEFNASSLASGMYVYRLHAGETVFTKRMMLVK